MQQDLSSCEICKHLAVLSKMQSPSYRLGCDGGNKLQLDSDGWGGEEVRGTISFLASQFTFASVITSAKQLGRVQATLGFFTR